MSAITTDDLRAFVRAADFDAATEVAAQMVLDNLQGEVEGYLGRPVEVRAFTEDYRWANEDSMLVLRNTPVISVASVVSRSVTASGTTTYTFTADDYITTTWGLDGLAPAPAVYPYHLRVTYNAGFDLSNPRYQAIRSVLLAAAARWYYTTIASDVMAESAGGLIRSLATDGGYAVQFGGGGATNTGPMVGSFFGSEMTAIKRFRRRG